MFDKILDSDETIVAVFRSKTLKILKYNKKTSHNEMFFVFHKSIKICY